MTWLVIAMVAAAVLVVVGLLWWRRRRSLDGAPPEQVDVMFTTGIVFAGAGVALATTLGSMMYGVMIAGLVMMAVGARRMHLH